MGFWTSLVLTGKNYSDNNLGVDRETADAIFSLFVEKGFFYYLGDIQTVGGETVPAYGLNVVSIESFKRFSDLPCYIKYFSESTLNLFRRFRLLFYGAIVLIVTAFFESIFSKFGECFANWLAK